LDRLEGECLVKPLCLGCMTGIDGEIRREPYPLRTWDSVGWFFTTQYAKATLHPSDLCLSLFRKRREAIEKIASLEK